jgi:hypothetical protein
MNSTVLSSRALSIPGATGLLLVALLTACGYVDAAAAPGVDDLVFVSEATVLGLRGEGSPGCAAMSVVSISEGAAVHRGRPVLSTTRIVANPGFTTVMAGQAAGALGRFYMLQADQASPSGWTDRSVRLVDHYLLQHGGSLITRDGEHLVASVREAVSTNGLGIYRLADIHQRSDEDPFDYIGDRLAFAETPSGTYASRIVQDRRDKLAHVLMTDSTLHTLDVEEMEFLPDSQQLPAIATSLGGQRARGQYATTSIESRFLVTNRWDVPEINVVDLYTGSHWSQDLGAGVPANGGVAINHGWENRGLMAVHARDALVVYWFDPVTRSLDELSRLPATGPTHVVPPYEPIAGAIAWSTSGDHIVAAIGDDHDDVAIVRVSDCGRRLELESQLAICELEDGVRDNRVLDLLTANGAVPPPNGYEPTCPQVDPAPFPSARDSRSAVVPFAANTARP